MSTIYYTLYFSIISTYTDIRIILYLPPPRRYYFHDCMFVCLFVCLQDCANTTGIQFLQKSENGSNLDPIKF